MNAAFLRGQRVSLRPLTPGDLDGPYVEWLNDAEVTRYLETGTFPSTREMLAEYVRRVTTDERNVMLAVIANDTGRHIGNVKLGPIHWVHRTAAMGIMIGEKASWGRGYGREAVSLIVQYGFFRLGLHRITLGVFADHAAAIRIYERLGFKVEGTLREELFRDGRFHDKLVMGVLREEFRPEKMVDGAR
jgi:RimJ/RimL family protein N-acetyltransferase